jgi:hypothetical protein
MNGSEYGSRPSTSDNLHLLLEIFAGGGRMSTVGVEQFSGSLRAGRRRAVDSQLADALRVLGIPADSDRERVTHAYRRLARATHPDVSPDPNAAERFAAVADAYRLASASSGHSRASGSAAAPSESSLLRPPPPRSYRPGDVTDDWAPAGSGLGRDRLPAAVSPYLRAEYPGRPPIVAGPVMVRFPHGDVGRGEA